MSDSTSQDSKNETNPVVAIDRYLQSLVHLLNGTEIEFPITIYVDGLVVAGYLTSGHKYFDGLAEQLKGFFGNVENVEEYIDHLTSPRETYLKEKTLDTTSTQYLHVREARIFSPGQVPMPSEGVWWRGRLSCVSAFNFGAIHYSQP
jgi:hypothetical protein